MLNINLLPAYVAQRRITNRLLAGFTILFLLIVVGFGGYEAIIYPNVSRLTTLADNADQVKQQVATLEAQATTAISSLGPIQTNLQFVKDVDAFNLAYIELYKDVARYTSPKILYSGMSVSGTTMTINAYTPSLADLGRYMMVMYREPDSSALAISAIPGYGSANPDKATTVQLPAGITGHLPGYKGAVHSFTVYRGEIVSVNSGGTQVDGTQGGMPQSSAPGPGETSHGGLFNAHKDGFPFTATLTLKKALTPPALPSAAGAANQGGAPGLGGPGGPGGPPM